MLFEWNPAKAAENLRKHGVSFVEATSVFFDSLSVTGRDPEHSHGDSRFVIFGLSSAGRVLVVAHTERAQGLRIISAREATRAERRLYEDG